MGNCSHYWMVMQVASSVPAKASATIFAGIVMIIKSVAVADVGKNTNLKFKMLLKLWGACSDDFFLPFRKLSQCCNSVAV